MATSDFDDESKLIDQIRRFQLAIRTGNVVEAQEYARNLAEKKAPIIVDIDHSCFTESCTIR